MATSSWSPGAAVAFVGSFAITCEVRDTQHQGPPGTTDDISNDTASFNSIEWVVPDRETIAYASHEAVYPQPGYVGHRDHYSATLAYGDSGVSFSGLTLFENVYDDPDNYTDSCGMPPLEMSSSTTIGSNNSYPDRLALALSAGWTAPRTCEVHTPQMLYILSGIDAARLPYLNTVKFRFLNGQGCYQLRTRRETQSTGQSAAQCPDWPDTLHP